MHTLTDRTKRANSALMDTGIAAEIGVTADGAVLKFGMVVNHHAGADPAVAQDTGARPQKHIRMAGIPANESGAAELTLRSKYS